jgi:parallel beta-helix repeat protein
LTRDNVTIDASNAGVILDGSQAPGGANGLALQSDNCIIRGLTIQNFTSNGIIVDPGAAGNTIGGDRTVGNGPNGQGNLIVGNADSGIDIRGSGADGNRILGNYIGIGPTGRFAQGNHRSGVAIWQGAQGNTVGGTAAGERNIISGNDHNGIWINGPGTAANVVQGNYVGTTADGQGPVGNGFAGIALQGQAQNNRIGGAASGAGNLISGNGSNGVYISDVGTTGNILLGNRIGVIGQLGDGVLIINGARDTTIGDGSAAGRNVISGNQGIGVWITGGGGDTADNKVLGNYIGTNPAGTAALPNGNHGVKLSERTHGNRIIGNLLSGNGNHGLVMMTGAHDNVVQSNTIGPDASGGAALGNGGPGGIDIADGAHDNTIGGLALGEGNVISGNGVDGIALFSGTSDPTSDNRILGNIIGLAPNRVTPMPNNGDGIFSVGGAVRTHIEGNIVAFNAKNGIYLERCEGHRITSNSIYSNTLSGAAIGTPCTPPPSITAVTLEATERITGTTTPGALVEIFSDDEDEGRVYEGFATADASGIFTFSPTGGRFVAPNVTVTSTSPGGNTTSFSDPYHLQWTVLLYLNGDNDLEAYMFDTVSNLVAAGGSPRANVLALVDGYQTPGSSGTVLYNLSHGRATPIAAPEVVAGGERNMGDKQTLVDFASWARRAYPAHHTMLSIVDHGGGWAPNVEAFIDGGLARQRDWGAGGSGLSWDFSSLASIGDYDYIDGPELREALQAIAGDNIKKLDVLFLDVCLMGLLEVAYQVKDYASFFVSSQNIGWAPLGPTGRYVQTIQRLQPNTTPRTMAELLVEAYEEANPERLHPFTVSAIDLAKMAPLVDALNTLAIATNQSLDAQASALLQAYAASQKFDYDGDLNIEATDGFVDLYDFARNASQLLTTSLLRQLAGDVMTRMEGPQGALVARRSYSDVPWPRKELFWSLDNAHGLSIFLPLGEQLQLPVIITETGGITRNLSLLETYSSEQLRFVNDHTWDALIGQYYAKYGSTIPVVVRTAGSPLGLQPADIFPPQTMITVTGEIGVGKSITIQWSATDPVTGTGRAATGVEAAGLWRQGPRGEPKLEGTQTGSAGSFTFTITETGRYAFAVLAQDRVGNVEPFDHGANIYVFEIVGLPLVRRTPSAALQ